MVDLELTCVGVGIGVFDVFGQVGRSGEQGSSRLVSFVDVPAALRYATAGAPAISQPRPFLYSCLEPSLSEDIHRLHTSPHLADTITSPPENIHLRASTSNSIEPLDVRRCDIKHRFRVVLILDIVNSYLHCYNNTHPPYSYPHQYSHYAAHTISASSRAHAACAAAWRQQLRAVFTAPVQQSGRPTRHSPSPRAAEPTDQARHNTYRFDETICYSHKHLRPLASILTHISSTTALTPLHPTRAVGLQPARLRLR